MVFGARRGPPTPVGLNHVAATGTTGSMDWQDWRRLFPVTQDRVHLNHAGVSPVSLRVAEAVHEFLAHAVRYDTERHKLWEDRAEAVRDGFARLIGATAAEIAFVKNTSEGLSLVAAGIDWRAGDNVLAVDGEYPSNVYPWWALRRFGVETRMIPKAPGAVTVEDVAALADARTRVVALSLVDWNSGARALLAPIGAFCRERGILFVVDGIQGVGAVSVDVEAEGIDCMAVGGHKWLLAPEGLGCLYVSRRIVDSIVSVLHGWKSVTNAEVYLPYHFEPRPDAAKFEPGTPSVLSAIGLGAAIDLLHEVGPAAITARLRALGDHCANGLRALGAEIVSPWEPQRRSGFLVFRLGNDAEKLAAGLRQEGFVVRARGGGVRVAPHFYIDEEDLNRLVATVRRLAA